MKIEFSFLILCLHAFLLPVKAQQYSGLLAGVGYYKLLLPQQNQYFNCLADSLNLNENFSKQNGFAGFQIGWGIRNDRMGLSIGLGYGLHSVQISHSDNSSKNDYAFSQRNLHYLVGLGLYFSKRMHTDFEIGYITATYRIGNSSGNLPAGQWDGGLGKGPQGNLSTVTSRIKLSLDLGKAEKPSVILSPYVEYGLGRLRYYDYQPLRIPDYKGSKLTTLKGFGLQMNMILTPAD